jgi:molybdopterin-guanine dinucleotide biosynthesis protein A/molybdopterin converting factor small subunit
MGTAKALLDFDGEPLIAHIVDALNNLFAETVVVAAPEQELPALPARLVRDEVAYQGPVGGIYYGLCATEGEFSFVTSCDAAFLNPQLITYLVSQIAGYDVVVPYWDNRFQPLHAVYRKSVVPFLREQLERGELRPIYLFEKVHTRTVTVEELIALDREGLSFLSMNTPEEYRSALKRWQQLRHGRETAREMATETEIERRYQTERGSLGPVSASIPAAGIRVSNAAVTCTVELFGTARLLAKTPKVSLVLSPEATLKDVFSALAETLPVLAGRVVDRERKALAGGYACNINGLHFVRDIEAKIDSGDKILILAADAGG